MEAKVLFGLYICCLQLLLGQQQHTFLVNGESIQNATSANTNASPKNGTNITITNYQIKNTPNVTKAHLQELVNGTVSNGRGEYLHSRKIKKTGNSTESLIAAQLNNNKGNTAISDSKNTTKLTMVAPNVVIDINTLKSNGTQIAVKLNHTNVSEITKNSNQGIINNDASVNATTNITNKNNNTVPITTPIAKLDQSPLGSNNSVEVKFTNSSVTNGTSTTTTKTTAKPKKPSITLGLGDFPHLPGEPIATETMHSKLPIANDISPPNAEPSQELNSGFNYHRSRDFIVPIMTVLFAIPLVCGVVITTYRRFRDCWSTRHYRRMDFLVDGMYND